MVRVKHRYFLSELKPTLPSTPSKTAGVPLLKIGPPVLKLLLLKKVRSLFGELGGSKFSSLQVKYLQSNTGIVLLRAPRDVADLMRSALHNLDSLDGIPISWKIIHVSGTIRSGQKALVKYDKKLLRSLGIASTEGIGESQ